MDKVYSTKTDLSINRKFNVIVVYINVQIEPQLQSLADLIFVNTLLLMKANERMFSFLIILNYMYQHLETYSQKVFNSK